LPFDFVLPHRWRSWAWKTGTVVGIGTEIRTEIGIEIGKPIAELMTSDHLNKRSLDNRIYC